MHVVQSRRGVWLAQVHLQRTAKDGDCCKCREADPNDDLTNGERCVHCSGLCEVMVGVSGLTIKMSGRDTLSAFDCHIILVASMSTMPRRRWHWRMSGYGWAWSTPKAMAWETMRTISSWMANTSSMAPSNLLDHTCWPCSASTSCAVMRKALPLRRTLPATT